MMMYEHIFVQVDLFFKLFKNTIFFFLNSPPSFQISTYFLWNYAFLIYIEETFDWASSFS